MESGRVAVSLGSSWRIEPAAELRGLAKVGSPASARCSFRRAKAAIGRYTSPRTSSSGGAPSTRSGNGPDRAQVLGDLLPHLAVPARGSAHQHAVLVDERDGQPVHLGLGHEADLAQLGALALEVALAAHHPRLHLLLVAGVGQREHRLEVGHLLELVQRLRPHPLRRRVGRAELRVLGLQVAQLVQQRVVLGVRDLRVVEDVVAVVGALELGPELRCAIRRSGVQTSRAAGRMRRSRSKPVRDSMPAWSVRSKCSGVTAMRSSASAAKSVPSSSWYPGCSP